MKKKIRQDFLQVIHTCTLYIYTIHEIQDKQNKHCKKVYLVFTFLSQAISRLFLLMARIRVQAFRKIENVAQKCSRRKKYEKRERKRVFQPLFILENVSVSTFSYFWQFFQWFLRQNKTLHLRTNINFCTKFLSLCRGGYFLLPNREQPSSKVLSYIKRTSFK